ncbi:MAG: 50S ribosomal protein L6, partial [Actinomycetia bacterium]|nr:50S ribosomal protein L6 [Actinomycetes bacterium]
MSRIGKMPIPVPSGVEVTVEGSKVSVKGPKGELSQEISPLISVTQEGDEIIVARSDDERESRSQHG